MAKKEWLKKLAELEERVAVLADKGKLDIEDLEAFEEVLVELEVLVR